MREQAWIGVDLDGTLARYESRQGVDFVGEPIPRMLDRVRRWLSEGKRVKILTARVCGAWGEEDRQRQVDMIEAWCEKHLGQRLEVTAVKDFAMVELWDDRAVGVVKNTGAVMDPVADIEEFHRKFSLEYTGLPRVLLGELGEFRRKFLEEELKEYEKEMYRAAYYISLWEQSRGALDAMPPYLIAEHLEGMLDALVDLVYVAIGTAHLHGFDFREAWRRVHEANMKKERAVRAEDSKRGTTYDVIKPPGWEAPTHLDLVANHAHRGESK